MKKKVVAALLCAAMVLSLAACGSEAEQSAESVANTSDAGETQELSGDLVFAIWDNNLMTYIDENDMVGKF